MTTTQQPATQQAAPAKIPFLQRINLRLITFSAVVLFLVGYPLYQYLYSEITGGIEHLDGGVTAVDLRAMSLFSFDQYNGRLDDVPQKWRQLDGKKVILTGEMWAPNSAAPEVKNFDLCYSIAKCCFSGPPQVQHFVKSASPDGRSIPIYNGLVKVKGTLHVNVIPGGQDGKVQSVYQLDVEDVKPVL